MTVWDAESFQPIGTLNERMEYMRGYFSRDSSRFITISEYTVKIWNTQTLRLLYTLNGDEDPIISASYSPDGRQIITSSKKDGTTKFWDAEAFTYLGAIHNVPGLEVIGVDLRHLRSDSQISDTTRDILNGYGAIVDERGYRQQ